MDNGIFIQKQPPEVFCKKGGLKNFRIIHRKTPVLELENTCNFIKKGTPTQVISCEYCEIFKNTYLEECLLTAGSVYFSDEGFILAS